MSPTPHPIRKCIAFFAAALFVTGLLAMGNLRAISAPQEDEEILAVFFQTSGKVIAWPMILPDPPEISAVQPVLPLP